MGRICTEFLAIDVHLHLIDDFAWNTYQDVHVGVSMTRNLRESFPTVRSGGANILFHQKLLV